MKNMKPISENPPVLNLPSVILSVIFSLLPTKSILSCKSVCKLWLSIIRSPLFSMSPQSIVLIVRRMGRQGNKNFHLVEPEFDYAIRKRNGALCLVLGKKSVTKINDGCFDGSLMKDLNTVNSCKGLVCMTHTFPPYLITKGALPGEWAPFFVCNPVTSDHVVVKKSITPEWAYSYGDRHAGLGFCSQSDQYKLLRFFNNGRNGKWEEKPLMAEVYTLGRDIKWRKIEDRPPRGYSWCGKATFFEGSIHWTIVHRETDTGRIGAFDCHEEIFILVDLPDSLSHGCMMEMSPNMDLATLQHRLCFGIWNVRERKDFEVWVMDEYGITVSWRKLFVIACGESPSYVFPFKPLAYLNNQEILMLSVNGSLVSYVARSSRWRAVKVHGFTTAIEAILLDPTFVPTKNLLINVEQSKTAMTEWHDHKILGDNSSINASCSF